MDVVIQFGNFMEGVSEVTKSDVEISQGHNALDMVNSLVNGSDHAITRVIILVEDKIGVKE